MVDPCAKLIRILRCPWIHLNGQGTVGVPLRERVPSGLEHASEGFGQSQAAAGRGIAALSVLDRSKLLVPTHFKSHAVRRRAESIKHKGFEFDTGYLCDLPLRINSFEVFSGQVPGQVQLPVLGKLLGKVTANHMHRNVSRTEA